MGIRVTEGRAFVRVRLGPTCGEERRCCEGQIARTLVAHGVAFEGFALNDGGCCFVIATADESGVLAALRSLNVAVRTHEACAALTVVPSLGAAGPPTVANVMEALGSARVDVVHLVCSDWGATVVVPERDARLALEALARLFLPSIVRAA